MHFLTIGFRTVIFYFLVLFLYRLMGKREVGQLSIIDLIIGILIAELVAISIENYNKSVFNSIIPIIILVAIQIFFAFVTMKSTKFRNIFEGQPSIIIKNGNINFKEMVKQRYNLDDLMTQLREQGVRNIEEVEYALLESSGKLSLFKKEPSKTDFPMPIILDGVIQKDVLQEMNKSIMWVMDLIEKENVILSDIFYGFYRKNKIYIIKRGDLV